MKLTSFQSIGIANSGLLADSINDADSTRKVYLLAAGLALLGVVLLVATVWFWRSTRPEPELLGPLEKMGERRFRRLDGRARKDALNSARSKNAKPMRWGLVHGDAPMSPEIDLEAAARTEMVGYDDLRDPAPPSNTSDEISQAIQEPDTDTGAAIDPLLRLQARD